MEIKQQWSKLFEFKHRNIHYASPSTWLWSYFPLDVTIRFMYYTYAVAHIWTFPISCMQITGALASVVFGTNMLCFFCICLIH